MKLNFDVDGNEYNLAGKSSSEIKKILKQLGIKPELTRKVAIASYEAEINMVIHGGGGNIKVEITTEKIYLCFTDEGPGISDVNLAMQVGYSTASDQAREMGFGAGMGLANMERYSDEMKITSGLNSGTKVEIEFYI